MLNDIINKRKSILAFNGKKIDDRIILSLYEAARKAPSSFNEQPWRFISASVEKKESFDKILETLNDKNRFWAELASLLVVVLSKKEFSRNNKPNRYYMFDTASAISNLTFQANSSGLYVHQMGSFEEQKVREQFSVPDEFEPIVILAIGYKGDSDLLPDNLKQSEKSESKRISINEILFENTFGEVHSLLNKTGVDN